MELYLIRHSMTAGNKKKRYIGTTDEPLCPEGVALLENLSYPPVEHVYGSPRKRCRETAAILYPGMKFHCVEELAECDFGEFENKNYLELADNPHYQQWIDSNGTLPFPGGESREEFRERVLRGFERVVIDCSRQGVQRAAVVVHGGTIMNLLGAYGGKPDAFYEWHVDNGEGYRVIVMEESWLLGKRSFRQIEKL